MVEIRRLVKAGASSHTVSLPKDWLEKNNLSRGDRVYIKELNEKELLISSFEKKTDLLEKNKEIRISTDKKNKAHLQRELTAAYLNNYQTITFFGEKIEEHAKDIREIVQHFVALEIAEQTQKHIVAKDLLNLNEISFSQTIRRMDMIIRSIIQDSIDSIATCGSANMESISFRDDDVNRLYFMLFRLLKQAIKDKELAAKFKINQEEILSLWYLLLNLENIADNCREISSLQTKIKKPQVKPIKNLYEEIFLAYKDIMQAYFKKDKSQAHTVAAKRLPLIENLESFFEQNKTLVVAQLVEQFKELINQIGNIARIIIDENVEE